MQVCVEVKYKMWALGGFHVHAADLSKHFMIRLHLGISLRRATERALPLTHLTHRPDPAARAHNLLLIKYDKHWV